MAHITGGGIPLNLTRSFPEGTAALVRPSSWKEPAIFGVIRAGGPVAEDEMRRTFNCGIGFALVVPKESASSTCDALAQHGETAQVIGEVIASSSSAKPGDVVYA
jgi:phosphoribosylformylglycinamidine cyclo-ligase